MKKRNAIFIAAVLAAVATLLASILLRWDLESHQEIYTGEKQPLKVIWRSKRRIHVGLPHSKGVYLYSGRTFVSVHKGASVYKFNADEELELVGLHLFKGRMFALFMADFNPGRGFLVYEQRGDAFDMLTLDQLHPQIAFPNFGSKGATAIQILGERNLPKEPPDDFFETATAWLWSQKVTGKSVLSEGIDREAVKSFWNQWAMEIATQIKAPKSAE